MTAGFDFNKGMSKIYDGHTKYAYGLTGYVRLAIYPPVYVADVFVRPSVAGKMLTYDVWVTNATKLPKTIVLKGALSSWNNRDWKYPAVPDREMQIPAGETAKVTMEVAWGLGPESYWWPKFRSGRITGRCLHCLNLSLLEEKQIVHQHAERFGFVEYKEGPYYYTVNGVRFTSFGDSNSYGQIGEYDCWSETACFQPPPAGSKAARRSGNATSGSASTTCGSPRACRPAYMLETADEAGYMLVPEGGSWGNRTCNSRRRTFPSSCRRPSAPAATIPALPATRSPMNRCRPISPAPTIPGVG